MRSELSDQNRNISLWRAALILSVVASFSWLGLAAAVGGAQTGGVDQVPGNSDVVRMARPTWDTGWFQAEIMAQMLTELGYAVEGPATMDNANFYRDVAVAEVDLWVNGWFPLHDEFLAGTNGARPIGFEVRGGALQGYLADRATVERLGISSLADLANPDIAQAFDRNGDGRADLIGCNDGWACQPIVNHHLDAYGVTNHVTQVVGDYGPLMVDSAQRLAAGESILFYTFTPNWTTGILVPGRDVVWLPVPFPSLPAELVDQEPQTIVAGVPGCLNDPCSMGFAPNDIRAVAGTEFLDENPAIAELLRLFEISLDDVSDQNALMIAGEDSEADIARHAAEWIAENRRTVDDWFGQAVDAHAAAGLPLSNRRPSSDERQVIGSLRVVTRLAAPFVTYDEEAYGGFSIELMELIAEDAGATLEIYGVNSSAKLVDDISRGSADVGIGAIAITSEREELVDFSQPYFDSGLQILVSNRSSGFLGGQLGSVVKAVFSRDLLFLCLVLLVVLVVAAHLIWLTERGHNPDFPKEYRSGIWEAIWWAAVTATTVGYGDKTPKGRTGRIFGLFWMFSGLFVLAYFTAGIATAFTIDEINNQIEETSDLRGHSVGVQIDSSGADFLEAEGIAATDFRTAEEAFTALIDGDVDAVVHDAAILQHFVTNDNRGGTSIAGDVFAERGFGLILSTDSQLAEPLNQSLLRLVESGSFDQLHDRWFGAEQRSGG